MQNPTLERIEIHAYANLPKRSLTKRGFLSRMKQLDRLVGARLTKFSKAEVAVWMCAILECYAEHIKAPRKG